MFWYDVFVILCLIMSVSPAVTLPPSKLTESDPEFWRQSADRLIEAFKDKQKASSQPIKRPKNVILFIGDGMSLATLTAARYLKAEQESKLHGQSSLVWDEWPSMSLVRTFSLNQGTTDSAASATAFLCGAKVNQYTLGVKAPVECCQCDRLLLDGTTNHVQSTLEEAREANKSVGLVTTTRITHATPAAAYAHSPDRRWEGEVKDKNSSCTDIAIQMIQNALNFDVILGGGLKHFQQRLDGMDLIETWQTNQLSRNHTYRFVSQREQLLDYASRNVDHLLGLFNVNHLEYEVDRLTKNEPSLAEMTEAAIRVLSRNPNGYLLLVEAGRIDHAHHENQARRALIDTLALDAAVVKVLGLVDLSDTLLIVTADHSHAYTMLGYSSRNASILGFSDEKETDDGKPYLSSAYSSGPGAVVNQSRRNPAGDDISDNTYKYQALVPMRHATHSSEDVPLYAIGPLSELFHSTIDNTFIAYAQRYALCLEPYTKEPHCKSAASTLHISIFLIALALLFIFTLY